MPRVTCHEKPGSGGAGGSALVRRGSESGRRGGFLFLTRRKQARTLRAMKGWLPAPAWYAICRSAPAPGGCGKRRTERPGGNRSTGRARNPPWPSVSSPASSVLKMKARPPIGPRARNHPPPVFLCYRSRRAAHERPRRSGMSELHSIMVDPIQCGGHPDQRAPAGAAAPTASGGGRAGDPPPVRAQPAGVCRAVRVQPGGGAGVGAGAAAPEQAARTLLLVIARNPAVVEAVLAAA